MAAVIPLAAGEHTVPAGRVSPEDSRAPERAAGAADRAQLAIDLLRRGGPGRLIHLERLPARPGRAVPWPSWVPGEIAAAFGRSGVTQPWAHQAAAAEHAHGGRNVILATGTASGKSLGYLMPALTAVLAGGTALYIAPTRALAADQLRLVRSLGLAGLRTAVIDGDTPAADRARARAQASYLLTTPDMLHHALLPGHARWNGFLRRLRYVIVDECHGYRGVFGSHVAQVLRRLRRITAQHAGGSGPPPVFILASATISEPGRAAGLLTGLPAEAVTDDAAPHGELAFGLWEPPLTRLRGEAGAPVRRTAQAEAAGLLTELVAGQLRALAFVRSRRGAEALALTARRLLAQAGADELAGRVAAYRSGYLADDRRALEDALRSGQLAGLATTSALELGVSFAGLDAVLIVGWPGTRAALWQQAGRAGRGGRDAVAVLIARDDPLDTYLVHHPRGPAAPAGRGDRARSGESLRAGAAPVRGRRRAAADRAGPGLVRPRRADGDSRADQRGPAARGAATGGAGPAGAGRRSPGCAAPAARVRDRGGNHRPAGRDGGRAVGPRAGSHRRRLPAPGRDLPGHPPRPGRGVALVVAGDPGYSTSARRADRDRDSARAAPGSVGGGRGALRRRAGDPPGGLVCPAGRRRPASRSAR